MKNSAKYYHKYTYFFT